MGYTKYRAVWLAAYGEGPWLCHGCGEPVNRLGGTTNSETGLIHHLDHDHGNNAVENLRVMHHKCHVRHHNSERTISEGSRRRMSDAQKRRRAEETPEVRDKFVYSFKGRKHSEEAIRKMSEKQRGKEVSEETREKLAAAARGNTNMKGKPRSEETKRKIAEALRGRKHTPEALQNITAANRRRHEKEKKE
jgi:hypothetical protein